MEENYTITTEGVLEDSFPQNGENYGLHELQSIVGGYIEIVYLSDTMIMVINEEGKFTCEPNPAATMLARLCRSIPPNDYIAGDVLVCRSELVK